jgi:cell pole-organizing protein PopZ
MPPARTVPLGVVSPAEPAHATEVRPITAVEAALVRATKVEPARVAAKAAPAISIAEGDPETSAAAASALGALAAGLAASSGVGNAAPTHASAGPSAPAHATLLSQAASSLLPPGAAPLPPQAAGSVAPNPAPAPTRTLEDAVAEMLRPLLQQWLADNMPRIIERALRVEVSKTVREAPKRPRA